MFQAYLIGITMVNISMRGVYVAHNHHMMTLKQMVMSPELNEFIKVVLVRHPIRLFRIGSGTIKIEQSQFPIVLK